MRNVKQADVTFPRRRQRNVERYVEEFRAFFRRQRDDVLDQSNADVLLDRDRWDPRLAALLLDRNTQVAGEFARLTARLLDTEPDVETMEGWLEENADAVAGDINEATGERLSQAVSEAAVPAIAIVGVFEHLRDVEAERYARSAVTNIANFAATDTAKRAARTKTWQVNSGNPRPAHAAMAGQTVPVSEPFSNGMMWPGGPNCRCSVVFSQ